MWGCKIVTELYGEHVLHLQVHSSSAEIPQKTGRNFKILRTKGISEWIGVEYAGHALSFSLTKKESETQTDWMFDTFLPWMEIL